MSKEDRLKAAGFMWVGSRTLWISTDRHIVFSHDVIADHDLKWLETKLAERVPDSIFVFHVNLLTPPIQKILLEVLAARGLSHLQPDIRVATIGGAVKRHVATVVALLRHVAQNRRRVILVAAAALYVLSVLYAPWVAKGPDLRVLRDFESYAGMAVQYRPIISPPHCVIVSPSGPYFERPCHYTLDVSRLLIEWIFIAMMAGIAWLWE